jgi:membrane protease YdiL (CAAX protease family)
VFRGFLLPALATAWDWAAHRFGGAPATPVDEDGQERWTLPAMVFAALVTSAPFALMHAEQLAHAWAPVGVLYGVSLVLCAVRLRLRSLAASVLVHAAYNFTIFAVVFAATGGFEHLERLKG